MKSRDNKEMLPQKTIKVGLNIGHCPKIWPISQHGRAVQYVLLCSSTLPRDDSLVALRFPPVCQRAIRFAPVSPSVCSSCFTVISSSHSFHILFEDIMKVRMRSFDGDNIFLTELLPFKLSHIRQLFTL